MSYPIFHLFSRERFLVRSENPIGNRASKGENLKTLTFPIINDILEPRASSLYTVWPMVHGVPSSLPHEDTGVPGDTRWDAYPGGIGEGIYTGWYRVSLLVYIGYPSWCTWGIPSGIRSV